MNFFFFFLKQIIISKIARSKYTDDFSVEKHACTATHGGLERARAEKAKRRRDETAHTHGLR